MTNQCCKHHNMLFPSDGDPECCMAGMGKSWACCRQCPDLWQPRVDHNGYYYYDEEIAAGRVVNGELVE